MIVRAGGTPRVETVDHRQVKAEETDSSIQKGLHLMPANRVDIFSQICFDGTTPVAARWVYLPARVDNLQLLEAGESLEHFLVTRGYQPLRCGAMDLKVGRATLEVASSLGIPADSLVVATSSLITGHGNQLLATIYQTDRTDLPIEYRYFGTPELILLRR